MSTSLFHIYVSLLPMIIVVPGIILLLYGWIFRNQGMLRLSMFLLAGTFVVSFIASALGGASMSKTINTPGVNIAALHIHAWSAFGVVVFSLALAAIAIQPLRKKKQPDSTTLLMMVLIALLVAAFLWLTMKLAMQIR